MGRHRAARAGARLQGAPCLDHADLRRRGRRDRPDRGEGEAAGVAQVKSASFREAPAPNPACLAIRCADIAATVCASPDDHSVYRCDCAGAATPPVGTTASAVLVDFGAGSGFSASRSLTKRSCTGFGLQVGDRRGSGAVVAAEHFGDRVGGHEIGQPQFFPRQFVQIFPRRHAERRATADRRRRPCRRCIWRGGRCRAPRSSGPARCSSRPWRRRRGRPSRSDAPGHARLRARNASCPTAAGTRTSIRNRLRARRWRDRPARYGSDADADRGQHTETAPAPSERDGVVDRTAAGIQHDGRAAEFASAREFVEILRAVRGDDADRADPAPAIRLARDPAEPHRQFAFFEGAAGMRRTARAWPRRRAMRCTGRRRRAAPSREYQATSRASIWFLPPSPKTSSGNGPNQRHMILSYKRYEKGNRA